MTDHRLWEYLLWLCVWGVFKGGFLCTLKHRLQITEARVMKLLLSIMLNNKADAFRENSWGWAPLPKRLKFGGDKKKGKQRNENVGTCDFFNIDRDSRVPRNENCFNSVPLESMFQPQFQHPAQNFTRGIYSSLFQWWSQKAFLLLSCEFLGCNTHKQGILSYTL